MSTHRLSLWSRPNLRYSWQGRCACGQLFGPAYCRGDIEQAHARHLEESQETQESDSDAMAGEDRA